MPATSPSWLLLVVTVLAGCGRFGFEARGADELAPDAAPDVDPAVGPDAQPGADPGASEGGGCSDDGTVGCDEGREIPATSFDRGNDASYPATVSGFVLDRFEVTVGRFRAFLAAGFGVRTQPPGPGDGAHPEAEGSGWRPSWDDALEADVATLIDRLTSDARATFTPAPGAGEARPINLVTWYEAAAFCAWDGGRLPSYAEFQAALVGGAQQRVYPWSSPPTSTTFSTAHVGATLAVAGAHPAGDGRWGHADLQGGVKEWGLDYYNLVAGPCDDCVHTSSTPSTRRMQHGEPVGLSAATYLATIEIDGANPLLREATTGFRCAR